MKEFGFLEIFVYIFIILITISVILDFRQQNLNYEIEKMKIDYHIQGEL